ncbi:serine/threonine-protein kinase [Streptomyces sp. TLI_105]|uniref:serine/threonine-protein kinase n=1 Tax=Streptomyces sp. TLI_105 TaxID=1881019 RepID=UPI00089A5B92|nr:serine/threonine-protein kinase [Streptomyces sp. TLI_105]SEE09333.1 Protein kinase domain-containing protein [Streptomyces sp. TLI_105]
MSTNDDRRPLVDGRFRLISRLGSGGMGTVWRARDIALDRDVALKEVRPPDPAVEDANPGFAAQLRERAVREARALARLSNPHVVTIHHIVEPQDGSHPWIVMELVEGSSVYDRLAAGPMPVPEVLALGRQVLSALRAAHTAGIQHRDVKPANVLLRHGGGAVLTDFGIAAFDGAASRLTSTGDLIGSPEFIAPERVRGEEGNPASDLWSLGMLLYVAAEGHHPLRRATGLATVVAVLDDPIPAPVRSGALGPVLTRLLVRDPAQRPDGALLDRLLAEAEGGAAAAPAPAAVPAAVPSAPVAVPAAPGPYAPAPAPYPHPAYGPPAAPGAGFGPPTLPTPAPSSPRKRAAGVAVGLALAAAAVIGVVNLFPDGGDGSGGTSGAKGGASPTGAVRTPGQGQGTGTVPSTSAPAPAVRGSLLTTANVRAVIEEFRRASGTTKIKDLTVYEEYALANIPTRPGAKTYDAYEYRAGVARKTGPGGTISADDADEQPFDVSTMPWDSLPALMKRGERDLKVDDPTMRYVVVDRWTFNDDRPTLRFYLSNDYSASGYLAADASGKVVSTLPAS